MDSPAFVGRGLNAGNSGAGPDRKKRRWNDAPGLATTD